MSNIEMIDIHDVAKIFNLSIEAVRKYKMLGFFEPCKRVGRKDFYDRQEILRRKDLVQSYKQQGTSLKKIEEKINELKEQKFFEEELQNTDAKKILIIEDKRDLVPILKKYLMAGFPEKKLKIYDAYDGLMGIELAISIKPDLIILDYTLPGIDGEEVYKRLMGNPNTCNAEFIIISGDVKFEPAGTKFLQKPFSRDELIEEAKRFLQIKTN